MSKPEAIPLDVLYEDEDLAVINKPAGMIIHPGAGAESGTMVAALLDRFGGKEGFRRSAGRCARESFIAWTKRLPARW